MSNYVDFLCVDCSVDADFDGANHQHTSFFAMLQARPQLESLAIFTNSAAYYFTDDLGKFGKALWFFSQHKGHRIVVKGEYGAIFNGCSGAPDFKTQTKEQREAWSLRDCALPHGHEGDHIPGEHAFYRCCVLPAGHLGEHNESGPIDYSNMCRANGRWELK